jgi:hypothetical protein
MYFSWKRQDCARLLKRHGRKPVTVRAGFVVPFRGPASVFLGALVVTGAYDAAARLL